MLSVEHTRATSMRGAPAPTASHPATPTLAPVQPVRYPSMKSQEPAADRRSRPRSYVSSTTLGTVAPSAGRCGAAPGPGRARRRARTPGTVAAARPRLPLRRRPRTRGAAREPEAAPPPPPASLSGPGVDLGERAARGGTWRYCEFCAKIRVCRGARAGDLALTRGAKAGASRGAGAPGPGESSGKRPPVRV